MNKISYADRLRMTADALDRIHHNARHNMYTKGWDNSIDRILTDVTLWIEEAIELRRLNDE